MCYAIPGKLVKVLSNRVGVVSYFGENRKVLVDYCDVREGDYVYAQGGLVIRKIPEREALRALEAWKDMFFEFKRIDIKQSGVHKANLSSSLMALFQKINQGRELSREEMLALLKLEDKNELKLLYETANNIRLREHGNACCVHGIIEFSNYCSSNCLYCGIRKDNSIKRYRMTFDEIVSAARCAVEELNFTALLIQSGEDLWYNEDILLDIVDKLRQFEILVFLSIGERSPDTYRKLYEAGARGALLRFETSNRDIFNSLRPGTDFEKRIELIRYLKKLGYVLATGFITGLPGETENDVVNNILMTKSLKPDMYSFGPFIRACGTPLQNFGMVNEDVMLKTIAVSRITDRNSNILITTALETLNEDARRKGLLAGANSLMLNVTPDSYKKDYSIYDNRSCVNKDINAGIEETVEVLHKLGRSPADLGYRKEN